MKIRLNKRHTLTINGKSPFTYARYTLKYSLPYLYNTTYNWCTVIYLMVKRINNFLRWLFWLPRMPLTSRPVALVVSVFAPSLMQKRHCILRTCYCNLTQTPRLSRFLTVRIPHNVVFERTSV